MSTFNRRDTTDQNIHAERLRSLTDLNSAALDTVSMNMVMDPLLKQGLARLNDSALDTEIVFILNNVSNIDVLLADIDSSKEVFLLDASQDGLQQIANILAGRTGLKAIHLISHGNEGVLDFGTVQLNKTNLSTHQEVLKAIGNSLSEDGDILLYGCDISKGTTGVTFVDSFAAATGADIAASINQTGARSLSGDWELERSFGRLDTVAMKFPSYSGLLATPADQDFDAVTAQESTREDNPSLTLGTLIFSANSTNDAIRVDTINAITGGLPTLGSGNGINSTWFGTNTGTFFQFASVSNSDDFKLVSLRAEVWGGSSLTSEVYTITGYNNGSQTVSATVTFTADGMYGTGNSAITYDRQTTPDEDTNSANTANAGLLTFGSAWNNIDQIRFTVADGKILAISLDQIDFSAAIPPASVTSVSASTSNGSYNAGDVISIEVTFSAAVTVNTGGGTPQLLLETGTLDRAAVYTSGSGTTTLVFQYTVQAGDTSLDLDYVGTSSLTLNSGTIKQTSDNVDAILTLPTPGAAGSLGNSSNIVIDTAAPTVSISLSDSNLKAGETPTVTFSFNEAVIGFTNVDVTGIPTGSLGAVGTINGGLTYTATYTPNPGVESVGNVISVDMAGVTDAAGNAGAGTANSSTFTIDTLRPDLSITLGDSTLTAGETTTATFTFTEAVSGFTSADITAIESGNLGALSTSDNITFTALFTPTVSTNDPSNVITVDKSGVTDAAGNAGSGNSSTANYTVNTVRPTVTVVVSDAALNLSETSLVTFTFSEAVTGFSNADLNVASGSSTAVSSGDGGVTWTATLTPAAATTVPTNVITVTNTGYTSISSGNAGSGTTDSNNYAIDTVRPTASISVADNSLTVGESSLVTFTFSEAVTAFDNSDVTGIPNGNLTAVTSADGGVTWTATYTPNASVEDANNLITVDMSALTDTAGNAGSGNTDSGNFAIDNARPTVAISLDDSTLTAGETATVTFTFNEVVNGFTSGDITAVEGGVLGALSTSDNRIYTALFTPTDGISDNLNVITVNQAGVTDNAGNAGSGSSSSANYVISTAAPTVTATFDDTSLIIGETAIVTFTFSEAVTGFSNTDLTIVGGTLTPVSSSNGGLTWTATFTPDADIQTTGNTITIDNTGFISVANGNPGVGTTDSQSYAIDTLRPTASIVVSDTSLIAGESSLVTITFSEPVNNFSNSDLTIDNGTLTAVSSADAGITWTATLTPSASISDPSNLITLNNTTITDVAGNAGTGTSTSNNYAVQTVRPTVTIAVADTALKIGDTSLVTFTFSEAVTGFSNADFTVANGALTAVGSVDGGITWTATLTPDGSVDDTSNLITVTNTGYSNAVGNTGTGTSNSNNYTIDTVQPTASIVIADTSLLIGETSLVTITFSEAVSDFSNADLTVENGNLSAVSSGDGGITWTATFTPTVDLQDALNQISLSNAGVTDLAGNAGTGTTNSNNYLIDTLRPTVSIGINDTALKVGDTAIVTFTFSEAVTNFTNADLTFPNGTLSPVSSGDGGTTWTATFTPSADIEDTSNVISVALAGLTDLVGNAGTGTSTSSNYAIDTVRPGAFDVTLTDGTLTVGETATISLYFNEPVTGLTLGDITVDNAVPSALSTSDGGVTWNFTATPNASSTNLATYVHVNQTNVSDAAGNTGVGISDFGTFVIDTVRPALVGSITLTDSTLILGETSTVSFAFTEAVTNLTSADLTTPNGTISNLTSGDGGISWTATLTPTSSVTDTSNVVTLDLTTITDLRGNAGLGTSSSLNYAVDTVRPVLASAITFSDNTLAIGETAAVGFTFAEAVSGFTTADILSPSGALSNLTTSDGGITWTATFTPNASTTSATNVLTLDYTGITDLAGNAGSGSATSANYAVDNVRPTLASAMTISDTALKIGETALVTFTFSEAVTNFTTADVTVENGALSNLSSANGGVTWTATLTPTASVTDTTNNLTLDYTGITDLVGNAGTGSAISGNYTIDTERPTVVGNISFSDNLLAIGETATMTVVFSEAVNSLNTSDFTVPNGAMSNLITGDGGITWTATLTPSADINDATNTITLANTGYVDLNGNTGSGTTTSLNYALDTLRPTATITMSDIDLGVVDTALVTFTFSEPVTGFTNADLTLPVTSPMGTLTPVSSNDGGLTWTATYTPPFGVLDTSNLISLNTAGVIDAVGNPGVAVVNSPNFTINTVNVAPSLGGATAGLSTTDSARILPFTGVTVTDPDIGALETATISLDNPLKGSFTPNSMALSGFYTNDSGVTYLHDAVTPTQMQLAIRALVFEPNPARLSVGTSDVTTFTIVVRDQHLAVATDSSTTLTISNVNSAPTDILLSDANVSQSEGANATIGLLSAVDNNIGDTHSFSLAAANAGNDNTKFAIVDNSLKVINPAAMMEKDYFVSVQVTDANGLSFIKKLTISLDDDVAPYITSIETLRSPRSTITTGSFIVKFNENVTGVSIDDFFLTSTDGSTAQLSSITALSGSAYRVYINQIVGTGALTLNLKAVDTGIADLFGNSLPSSVPPAPHNLEATAPDLDLLVGVQQLASNYLL